MPWSGQNNACVSDTSLLNLYTFEVIQTVRYMLHTIHGLAFPFIFKKKKKDTWMQDDHGRVMILLSSGEPLSTTSILAERE